MSRTALLLVAGTVIAFLCASAALGRSTGGRADVTCSASSVRYDAGGTGSLSTIPWVRVGKAARAYLFFYGAELTDGRVNQSPGVVMYTGGGTSAFSTKILWAPSHPGSQATISGTRLDAGGSFRQRLARAGGGVFPSIVTVPAAGCWKLTLRAGKTTGSVVVRAVDPSPASSCDAAPVRRDAPDPIGAGIPWLVATPGSAGITGTIFYSLPTDATAVVIYPNKQAPNNGNTKILWKVPGRTAGLTLVVSARRLDAPGLVAAQTFPLAHDSSPGVSFPSGIDVSSTGCWLLTIRSGKAAAVAVFNSVPAV
jgi:hypothetical protein